NYVFFEDKLQQIGKGLQDATVADTIWTKPSLDKSKDAPFRQHRVGDDQQDHHEGYGDSRKLESYIDRSIHQTVLATDFTAVIWYNGETAVVSGRGLPDAS